MTRYLLDTSVLIDVSKQPEVSLRQLQFLIADGDQLCTCAVVIAEFYAGVAPVAREAADRFLETLHFLEASRHAGFAAGRYRYDFARKGRTLATADALIAAVAREWNATILTENLKDFPMDDVIARSLRTLSTEVVD